MPEKLKDHGEEFFRLGDIMAETKDGFAKEVREYSFRSDGWVLYKDKTLIFVKRKGVYRVSSSSTWKMFMKFPNHNGNTIKLMRRYEALLQRAEWFSKKSGPIGDCPQTIDDLFEGAKFELPQGS